MLQLSNIYILFLLPGNINGPHCASPLKLGKAMPLRSRLWAKVMFTISSPLFLFPCLPVGDKASNGKC